MKLRVTTEVEAPEGATHYLGDLLEDPTWLKCRQIGAVGDHWFYWGHTFHGHSLRSEWILMSHYKPHWAKETKDHETKDIRGRGAGNKQYLLLRLSDGTVVKVRATLYYGAKVEMPEQDLTDRFARELEHGAIMVSVDREGNEKRNLEVIHAFE